MKNLLKLSKNALKAAFTPTCCVFRPGFGVRSTPNAGQNILVLHFHPKKLKKEKSNNIDAKFSKKSFFEYAPKCWARVIFKQYMEAACRGL